MKPILTIIETPRGSSNKYNYDKKTKWFHLKKTLPAGMFFPFDFGFIPGTKGGDGDPLDIMVFSEYAFFPGCAVECRVIGGFMAEQSEEPHSKTMIRNDRFFAVPETSVSYKGVVSIQDMPQQLIREIGCFFVQYNQLEDKEFKLLDTLDAAKAMELIKKFSV